MNDRIDLVVAFRRRWRTLVVALLLGAIAGAVYSATSSHDYVSTSRLYVSVQALSGASGDPLQNSQAAQQRLVSYASLATSAAVTDAVSRQLDTSSSDLAGRITASYPPGTVLLDIAASSTSPESAQQLTAAVDDALQRLVARIETPAGGGSPAAALSVVDPPTEGALTGRSASTLIGAGLLAGLVVGLLVAYARERFDHTVRTADDLAEAAGIDVVDPIAVQRKDGDVLDSAHVGAGNSLVIRSVRSQLQLGSTGRLVVLVTGVRAATGPVAEQLSQAFVDSGVDTLLVRAHKPLDDAAKTVAPGLAEVLTGSAELTDTIAHTAGAYDVLPTGHLTDDAANLLSSQRCVDLIDQLGGQRGCVVIDASHLESSPETAAIARVSTAVVVVVELETITVDELRSHLRPITDMSATDARPPRLMAVPLVPVESRGTGGLRGVVAATIGRIRGRWATDTTARANGQSAERDSYPVVAAPMASGDSGESDHARSTDPHPADAGLADAATTGDKTSAAGLSADGTGSMSESTRPIGIGPSHRAQGGATGRTMSGQEAHAGTTPVDRTKGIDIGQRWRRV